MNKIFSFSLYGSKIIYLEGAINNAKLVGSLFPNFKCRFYIDNTVPIKYRKLLIEESNNEVVDMTGSTIPKMMWRFLPADDKNVELFLSRDVDSRVNFREKKIIEEWVCNSEKRYLIIKDHPSHYSPSILGGLWGMKNKFTFNMEGLIKKWCTSNNINKLENYNDDQIFLDNMIFPLTLDDSDYYDNMNFNNLSHCKRINSRRKNYEFIGEVFDENNNRMEHYKILREYELRKKGLVGKIVNKILVSLNF
jgi:hypothetical protein